MKRALLKVIAITLVSVFFSMFFYVVYARSEKKASSSNFKKPGLSFCLDLEELKERYFHDNDYNQFVRYLNPLEQKKDYGFCPYYYIALARYKQLKYLEEKQIWDEYFTQGNSYRADIDQNLVKIFNSLNAQDKLYIYSRVLFWQFHRDQQDAFSDTALLDLVKAALEYALKEGQPEILKMVADTLLSYSEKSAARQIYKSYVEKMVSLNKHPGEIKDAAFGFYQENNLELAELLYDHYINKIKFV
ncbi:MAG: hypothetical protein KKE64_06580, partial [Candidatus Omnitrophica bacterium]|nr:hypothetical protein [Candidatus Omnitrophota bacterium]